MSAVVIPIPHRVPAAEWRRRASARSRAAAEALCRGDRDAFLRGLREADELHERARAAEAHAADCRQIAAGAEYVLALAQGAR